MMKTPKNPRHLSLLLFGLLLGLALAGCSNEENPAGTNLTGTDDYENMDFSQTYGGLTATDEPEAFGDPYLMQLDAVESAEESDDPLQVDPEVAALEALSEQPLDPDDPTGLRRPRFTFLKITWGMLDGEVDALGNTDETQDLLDWSGMLTVDRGIVVVRRVILFERPHDHLIFPRLNRRTVAWISYTGRHYDGLLIEIIERPTDLRSAEGAELAPNMLHFHTGPYSGYFAVRELPDLNEIHDVDDEGNAIQFAGFRLSDIRLCPKGFLSGIWHSLPNVDANVAEGPLAVGVFKGRWVSVLGHMRGFMRGRYGYDANGERVFVGKYIDRRGRFQGFLRGTWEPLPENRGHGVFRGHWVNAAETVQGVLGGDYFHLPERPGGFFGGRWATLCDQEAVDTIQ
jgi:hypothetical protein